MKLGEYLRIKRGTKSLDEISAETGLDKGYLSKMELGLRHPKPNKFPAISKAYHVSLTTLFRLSGYLEEGYIICRAKNGNSANHNSDAKQILDEIMEED